MYKMIILITPRVAMGHEIGQTWEKLGAPGVTYIPSYGQRRLTETSKSIAILPGMMSLFEIMLRQDKDNLTMISVVDETLVDAMIQGAETVLGNLNQDDVGVVFVIDVERSVGLRST